MLVGKVRGAQETGARMAGCTGWGLWKIKNESWTRSSEGPLTRVELASPSGRANQVDSVESNKSVRPAAEGDQAARAPFWLVVWEGCLEEEALELASESC